MSSNDQRPLSAAAISSASRRTLSASLRTGMTTETAGAAVGVVSGILSVELFGRLLLAEQPAGNHLDAAPGRTRHRTYGAIASGNEGEPPRRKPVTHQDRAEAAQERSREHIAHEVRLDNDAARQNERCVNPHYDARLWPERPDRNRGRHRRRCMTRRHAGVRRAPRPRDIDERSEVGRPQPANESLHDGDEQPGQSDCDEYIAEADDEARRDEICDPARRRPCKYRRQYDEAADGNQEPVGFPEIGDLVEGLDQPERQRSGKREAARIDEQHREANEKNAGGCARREPQARRQEPRFREAAWPHEQRKPAKKRTRDAADAAFRHG